MNFSVFNFFSFNFAQVFRNLSISHNEIPYAIKIVAGIFLKNQIDDSFNSMWKMIEELFLGYVIVDVWKKDTKLDVLGILPKNFYIFFYE